MQFNLVVEVVQFWRLHMYKALNLICVCKSNIMLLILSQVIRDELFFLSSKKFGGIHNVITIIKQNTV